MKNAYSFWGSACGDDTADGEDGCNGDGDGTIRSINPASDIVYEPQKAWEHLTLAGLIEGTFSPAGREYSWTPANTLSSKLSNGFWAINYQMLETGDPFLYTNPYLIGIGTLVNEGWIGPNLITNEEAWNIDSKLDDGHAETGMMRSMWDGNCSDHANADPYSLAADGNTAKNCIPQFKIN